GERRVDPAVTADRREAAQALEQLRAAHAAKRRRFGGARIRVYDLLELGDAAGDERVLPDDGGPQARELEHPHRPPLAPAGLASLVRGDVIRPDELIEGGRERLTERRGAEHGVDAGQVVVHA